MQFIGNEDEMIDKKHNSTLFGNMLFTCLKWW